MIVPEGHDRLCRYHDNSHNPCTCDDLKARINRIRRGEPSGKVILDGHDTLCSYNEDYPATCTCLDLRTRDFFTNHKGTRHV